MNRIRSAAGWLAFAVCMLVFEGCAVLSSFFTPEFWGKVWRLLFAGLLGVVAAVVLHFPLMGGFSVGAAGGGAAMALEPAHVANVTNVDARGAKGPIYAGGQDAPARKFVGLSAFWWGVILSQLVPFLLRNRTHLLAVFRGEREGAVLNTWAHMLWGRALKLKGEILRDPVLP